MVRKIETQQLRLFAGLQDVICFPLRLKSSSHVDARSGIPKIIKAKE